MKWLIVEDALRDRSGHWLEFVNTFRDGLADLGDLVTVLGPCDAVPDVIQSAGVMPLLPQSTWRREKDAGYFIKKIGFLARWIVLTVATVRREVRIRTPEVIFVPTVGIPHLIAWYFLITFFLPRKPRILLYFMASPVRQRVSGEYQVLGIGGRLFFFLLKRLAHRSRAGKLILATEALPLSTALAAMSGAAFHTLPQPVNKLFSPEATTDSIDLIVVGSYGPARFEKGSDILVAAIDQYLASNARKDILFAVQWLEDFQTPEGEWVRIPERLKQDLRFRQINHLFADGEYANWLAKTSLMILPYGPEYALRGSRVLVEAMIHGIPSVVTRNTTLESHGLEFGAAVSCNQNSIADLTKTIQYSIDNLSKLREEAERRAVTATECFSVRHFRKLLLEGA